MVVSFKSKLNEKSLEDLFGHEHYANHDIKNTTLFNRIENFIELIKEEDEPDHGSKSTWINLYLPVKEHGEIFTYGLRVNLSEDHSTFSIQSSAGKGFNLHVSKGSESIDRRLLHIPRDTANLFAIIKENGEEALNVPYDAREGKVKSFYVLDHIISPDERADIENRYNNHIINVNKLSAVSLNQYIEVAAMLRKVCDPNLADLSPEELHRISYGGGGSKWDIADWNSSEEFTKWKKSSHTGSHPFTFGSLLTRLSPPSKEEPYFTFAMGSSNAREYLAALNVLMHNNVAFRVDDLSEKLDFFEGKSDVEVNGYWRTTPQCYGPEDCDYFHAIRWESLPLPKFK